jgi:hypothetical protein
MTDPMTTAWLGLISAAVGATPAVFGVVMPWLRDRDRIATERRRLELAKVEVDFIAAWLDAAAKLSGPDFETMKAEARERLNRLLEPRAQATLSPADHAASRRSRWLSWAFYDCLGLYSFMLLGASVDESDNISLAHFFEEFKGDGLTAIVLFAIPLVGLYIARRLAARRQPTTGGMRP